MENRGWLVFFALLFVSTTFMLVSAQISSDSPKKVDSFEKVELEKMAENLGQDENSEIGMNSEEMKSYSSDVGTSLSDVKEVEKEEVYVGSSGSGSSRSSRNSVQEKRIDEGPKFTGVVRVYDGGVLQGTRLHIDDIFIEDPGNLGETSPRDYFNQDSYTWPNFYLDLINPADGSTFEGDPYNLSVKFNLEDEGAFEEEGYEIEMEFCQVFALDDDDRLYISDKFSLNSFQNSYTVQLNPNNYSLLAYCSHAGMGPGASEVVDFSITSPVGDSETQQVLEDNEEDPGYSGSCVTQWACDDWGPCIAGEQFRSCSKVVEACYADPADRPVEVQTCEQEFEELSAENAGILDGAVARITGAVVGATNNPGMIGVVAFILVIIAGAAAVRVRKMGRS